MLMSIWAHSALEQIHLSTFSTWKVLMNFSSQKKEKKCYSLSINYPIQFEVQPNFVDKDSRLWIPAWTLNAVQLQGRNMPWGSRSARYTHNVKSMLLIICTCFISRHVFAEPKPPLQVKSMLKHRHLLSSILTMLYSPPPQSLFHVWKMSLQAIAPNLLSKLLLIFPYQLSWNHRMAWVGRNLKDHLVSTPLRWTGTPFTRPGCSGPHPTCPWTLPEMGHPQFLWAPCSDVSPPSQ